MNKRNIVVIGASAGGFEAIKKLVSGIPPDLDAAIFIVWHISPTSGGILPDVLNRLGGVPAAHGIDNEPIRHGRIYVAPPDHHLLIGDGTVRVTKGPKENHFRPAIDPLFRSAAAAYGPGVIGVILSGALDDGTSGIFTIKRFGGKAIVQKPEDAEVRSMPENAIEAIIPDYVVPAAEMGTLISKLSQEMVPEWSGLHSSDMAAMETSIALDNEAMGQQVFDLGELTPYTCPECHGVLAALKEGTRIRFRCHTGHAFSAESLLSTITNKVEDSLWNTIRSIRESVILLNHMGDHFAEVNQPQLAALYFQKAKDAEERAHLVRKAVMEHEKLSAEKLN